MNIIKETNKVTKSNRIIESKYRLKLNEQRFLLTVISQIQPDDEDFKKYRVDADEFGKLIGITSKFMYGKKGELAEIIEKLQTTLVTIPNPIDESWGSGAWLSWADYFPNKGYVEVQFHPNLKPYFLNLKKAFTSYQLKNVVKLKSAYSIRIYELLKQYQKIGERLIELEDFRDMLGLENKHKLYGHFKSRVLEPARKELQKTTDIKFFYKEIKHGKKVVGVKFFIFENDPNKDDDRKREENIQEQHYNQLYEKLSDEEKQLVYDTTLIALEKKLSQKHKKQLAESLNPQKDHPVLWIAFINERNKILENRK